MSASFETNGDGDDGADSMERVCRVFSEILSVGFTAIPNDDLEKWRADIAGEEDQVGGDEADVGLICEALRRRVGLCGGVGDEESDDRGEGEGENMWSARWVIIVILGGERVSIREYPQSKEGESWG